MTYLEYNKLVEETKRTRKEANANVYRIARAIQDVLPGNGAFTVEMHDRVQELYIQLGRAIETAKTASDIVDYYVNDGGACTDLDRIEVKPFEEEDEYI